MRISGSPPAATGPGKLARYWRIAGPAISPVTTMPKTRATEGRPRSTRASVLCPALREGDHFGTDPTGTVALPNGSSSRLWRRAWPSSTAPSPIRSGRSRPALATPVVRTDPDSEAVLHEVLVEKVRQAGYQQSEIEVAFHPLIPLWSRSFCLRYSSRSARYCRARETSSAWPTHAPAAIGKNKSPATTSPMSGRRNTAKRTRMNAATNPGTAVSTQVTRRYRASLLLDRLNSEPNPPEPRAQCFRRRPACFQLRQRLFTILHKVGQALA